MTRLGEGGDDAQAMPCPSDAQIINFVQSNRLDLFICPFCHFVNDFRSLLLSKLQLVLQGHLVGQAFGLITQITRPIIHHRKQMITCINCRVSD